MIKQIKDAIQKMERNKKRLDIYQYLRSQWKLHYDSPQLCVLIMEQMVSFLLELESPWAIPEDVNEYQYYADFLQEVLQYGMKHHCNNKMFLWQLCYYLAGISTYHFLYGDIITVSYTHLGGNILSKKAYAYTTGTLGAAVHTDTYTYGDANWKDKLTAFNGKSITYDAIGNPLKDSTWTYTWGKGRQLQYMVKNGDAVYFYYNEDGVRLQKTATGTTGVTKYSLHGKNIVHLTNAKNNLHFFYDARNKPAVVTFNGTAYAYLYNLQGDVIALIDSNGKKVVEYKYDAWGRILSKTGTMASTLGTLNPFRYRGYVYDEETGLYYLRSRYYNPEWARFLNADANIGYSQGVNSHNLMAYCCNKPVNNFDPDGRWLLFASICLMLGGVFYTDHKIATMHELTDEEKLVARAHPIEAAIAKNASNVAGKLTDDYWGKNATNYDATAANAFKHAVCNALMTRDLGYTTERNFATAHEAPYYGDMTPYKMWYLSLIHI